MGAMVMCETCGNENIRRLGGFRCYCNRCKMERGITIVSSKKIARMSPQERVRQAVYATGNRWAIENFENTH